MNEPLPHHIVFSVFSAFDTQVPSCWLFTENIAPESKNDGEAHLRISVTIARLLGHRSWCLSVDVLVERFCGWVWISLVLFEGAGV